MNSNHTDNTTNNSHSMKQQVLQDIKKVKDDIQSIKHRMTPGQIIDDALYSQQSVRDPAATFELLKKNPVGTSFLTLGTILLTQYQGNTFESQAKTKVSNLSTQVGEKVTHLKDNVSHYKADLKQTREKLSILKSEVTGFGTEIGQEKTSSVKNALASGREKLQEQTEHIKQLVQDVNPLAFVALGAGLGAMTGATLPVTQAEEKVGLKVADKLANFRTEFQEAINESVNVLKNELISGVTDFKVNLF